MNPEIVIQLWLTTVNPCPCPLMVTLAPAAVRKVIGAPGVPEWFTFTFSRYVPELTTTVVPAAAAEAAAPMVQYGWLWVPDPPSEQADELRST